MSLGPPPRARPGGYLIQTRPSPRAVPRAALLALLVGFGAPTALLAARAAAPAESPEAGSGKAVRLAYRFRTGDVIRTAARQVQRLRSEAKPDLAHETTAETRVESRVVEMDRDGTALVEETTTYEKEPGRKDRRKLRTGPLGEVYSVEVLEGKPTTMLGGPLFQDRSVRPGDSWPAMLRGTGTGPYEIRLEVTLASTSGKGDALLARLALSGKMDGRSAGAMLGLEEAGGVKAEGCTLDGEMTFAVKAGREAEARLALECALEITRQGEAPAPATLTLINETRSEDAAIPNIPGR